MRWVLLLILFLGLTVLAYAIHTIQRATRLDAPDLVAEPYLQDLGTIPQGQPAQATFRLTNRFAVPLTITHAWAYCTCTTPRVETSTLAPGESTLVHTTWNTRGLRGSQGTEISIQYELATDRSQPTPIATRSLQLGLRGVIQPRLKLSTELLEIDPDQETYAITITDTREPQLAEGPITGAQSSHPAFQLRIVSSNQLEVRVQRHRLDQVGSEPSITIITSDPEGPYVRIPIVIGRRKG